MSPAFIVINGSEEFMIILSLLKKVALLSIISLLFKNLLRSTLWIANVNLIS